ncbi:MAG: hypothetical protein J6J60_04080 [Clostridia bacterium]|nr:hypothetical protein [Clostridia bacterium]MBP3596561.1 hypothetical protein [Clostridia bacterium]
MKKIILRILVILLILYVLFVTVDCIRLRYTKSGTKPLITISLGETENGKIYKGLGYSIRYYIEVTQVSSDQINACVYGAECRLFDKILIWAWVE